jgi:hypothetical protein
VEGGHIELHKMLVHVKTKAYAPDIKIFQVLYTAYRDAKTTCVTTQNTETFIDNHRENLRSFIAYLNWQRGDVASAYLKDSLAFQVD